MSAGRRRSHLRDGRSARSHENAGPDPAPSASRAFVNAPCVRETTAVMVGVSGAGPQAFTFLCHF